MEVEVSSAGNEGRVKLTKDLESQIVGFVREMWDKGEKARQPYMEDWEKHSKAYDCRYEPKQDKRLNWRSKAYLPWVYDAIETAHSYLYAATLPKDDDLFFLEGRTKEDQAALDEQQKFEAYHFEKAAFSRAYNHALKNFTKKAHFIMKEVWRVENFIEYPLGEAQVKPKESAVKGLSFEVVEPENFVFFPTKVPPHKRTEIEKSEKYIEDIIATASSGAAPYFNVDELKQMLERQTGDAKNKPTCVKEAWIHRIVLDGKVYRNYIATVVDDKILVRFQPNRYPQGRTPYHFEAYEPDGQYNWGYGLCSKALPVLYAANDQLRAYVDSLKLDAHQMRKYWDDGVFDPYAFVARPMGLVKMSQESVAGGNLMPMETDISKYQVVLASITALKAEFQEVTIPQIIKGQIEEGVKTATEASLIHQNSGSKLGVVADRLNKGPLKGLIELGYLLISTMVQMDPSVFEEFVRVVVPSQEVDDMGNMVPVDPMEAAAKIKWFPLPEIDVKVVGYDHFIRRQSTAANIESFLTSYAQTPGGKYIRWYESGQDASRMLGLDTSRILADADEKQALDQAEGEAQSAQQAAQQQEIEFNRQMQQALVEVELAKIESNKQIALAKEQTAQIKLQVESAIKEAELELKQQEFVMKYTQPVDGEAVLDERANASGAEQAAA